MSFFKLEFNNDVLLFNLVEIKDYDNRSNGYILKTTDDLSVIKSKMVLRRLKYSFNGSERVVQGIYIKDINLKDGLITILHNTQLR